MGSVVMLPISLRMIIMIDDFFAKAHELVQRGVPFVTATVVRAERPVSARPGDKAIITIDGVMHGWIGGSCAQPTVIKEGLKALAADEARLIRLSTDPAGQHPRDGLLDLPMTCFSGGTLEIYLEPQPPRPRLLIVGTLPVARSLARLGAAMNYHIVVADLDETGEQVPDADEMLTGLQELAAQIRPYTYVVVASHGNYDEHALQAILPQQPSYVGLVASPRRAAAVRDYLLAQGLTETELLPLKGPAGLDIQARRGDEIALSIMAEIVQHRRNAEQLDLNLFRQQKPQEQQDSHIALQSIHVHHGHEHEPAQEVAMDPICGMEVVIATARYTHEHEGQKYYFCCPGCQSRFMQQVAAGGGG